MPANETAYPPSARRRAAKACNGCRARKVRCDVLKTGVPCTNCQTDRFECSVLARKKRSKSHRATPGSYASTNSATEAARTAVAGQWHLDQHVTRHQIPHYPVLRGLAQYQDNPSQNAGTKTALESVAEDRSSQATETAAPASVQYLASQGAFDLPPPPVLDAIIANYFKVFHPFFPVVHKQNFLDQYSRRPPPGQLHNGAGPSLLLLQAIIFTSIASIDWSILQQLHFKTRLQARITFHARARCLYEFDWESDNIIVAQALLLMSHHYPSMTNQKHTWFWAQQAIGLAQGAGLHRDPGPVPQKSHWARIWWTCLSRDRLIAIGTGRPMHINSLDCSVPMLTSDDLEEPGDTDEDRAIKTIFIEFIRLCQYIEGILSLHGTDTTSADALQEQIDICDDTLRRWQSHLPPIAKLNLPLSPTDQKIASTYRAVLHMTFNIAIIALNQSRQAPSNYCPSDFRLPGPKVKTAACNIRDMAADLIRWDAVKLCPTICVTSILSSLIVHLLVQKFEPSDANGLQSASFRKCMEFISQLSDIYWHAGFYHELFVLASTDKALREQDKASLFGLLSKGSTGRAMQQVARQTPTRVNRRETLHTPSTLMYEDVQVSRAATPAGEEASDLAIGTDAALFEEWLQECGYHYNSLPSA